MPRVTAAPPHRIARRLAALMAAAVLPVALAACSGGGSPSSGPSPSDTTTSPPTTTTQASTTTTVAPTTTTASTTTTTIPTVPMQTPQGGEFLSPSRNIGCEVDYQRSGITKVFCQTVTPPQSVTMKVTGSLTQCSGEQCLGNSGIGTPILPYDEATGVGPYRCVSMTTGVTCTANGGQGFRISKSGITPVTTAG